MPARHLRSRPSQEPPFPIGRCRWRKLKPGLSAVCSSGPTAYLAQHGADSPRLDAELLLAEARSCQRIDLYTRSMRPATTRCSPRFGNWSAAAHEGTPVAYLVGRREFYSLSFRVTPDVLIPRPETEFVVVALLDRVRSRPDAGPLRIADVGTGSGILAICAGQIASAQITATDVSPAALEVARANALEHQVADRIQFVLGDLLAEVPQQQRFDYIVSNPPYVSRDELAQLARDVKDHEPRIALDGGPDGMSVITRLVDEAAQRLEPGGWLLCEISPMIHPRTQRLLEDQGGFEEVSTVHDLAQLPRVLAAKRKK